MTKREGPAVRERSHVSIVGAERFRSIPSRSTLARWVRAVLERGARITLVLADTRTARRLNRTYRGRDYATNVLTFGYQQAPVVFADVVVCVAVARTEAAREGKSLRAHLAHLVIHGVLHAQGYDHVRRADAQRMQALEIKHLARLGIPSPYYGTVTQ
jgi:probable rRNA maturation factor